MPSPLPLPTIPELIKAFDDAVVGQKDSRADVHRGSGFDLLAGLGAILFSREASRDRDNFRDTYFDLADGDQLQALGIAKFGATSGARAKDTFGVGSVTLVRPNASAGQGTVYAGTRIYVLNAQGLTDAKIYKVASDTPVGATALSVPVPITATTTGAGVVIFANATNGTFRIDDPIWDTTWAVQQITCADGTVYELAPAYRSRLRQGRVDARVGYFKAIVTACQAVGAVNVFGFASDYPGGPNDYGLNVVYVGDAGFSSTQALLNACLVALEGARVAGADLQVLGMAFSAVPVTASVSLWDDPSAFNLADLTVAMTGALAAYFDGRANAFAYRIDAMGGAMREAIPSIVQNVAISAPPVDANLMFTLPINTPGAPLNFPFTLNRYTLGQIGITYTGPV